MDQILMLLASIFAGLCASSLVLLTAEMLSAIDVEKVQFGEDARHIPVLFRVFLPFTPNFRRLCASEALSGHMRKLREQLAMAGYVLYILHRSRGSPNRHLILRVRLRILKLHHDQLQEFPFL